MDKNWKVANMKLISNIYLNTELDSIEDWVHINEEMKDEGPDEVK